MGAPRSLLGGGPGGARPRDRGGRAAVHRLGIPAQTRRRLPLGPRLHARNHFTHRFGRPGSPGPMQASHLPRLQIVIDRAAIARVGVSVADVQSVIETALGGSVPTQVLEGERAFDLVVKLTPGAVSDLDSIRAIPIFGANGERLTLDSLASVD